MKNYQSDSVKTMKVLASAKLEPPDDQAAAMAALFSVANLLMNLDETITKG